MDLKKYCVVCGISVSVLMGSGKYLCSRCNHEVHIDDEPVRNVAFSPSPVSTYTTSGTSSLPSTSTTTTI